MKRATIKRLVQRELGVTVSSKHLQNIVEAMAEVGSKEICTGAAYNQQWTSLVQEIKDKIVAEAANSNIPHAKLLLRLDNLAQRLYASGCTADSDVVSQVAEELVALKS